MFNSFIAHDFFEICSTCNKKQPDDKKANMHRSIKYSQHYQLNNNPPGEYDSLRNDKQWVLGSFKKQGSNSNETKNAVYDKKNNSRDEIVVKRRVLEIR